MAILLLLSFSQRTLFSDNLQGVVCGGIDVFIHTLKICDSLLTQCSKMAHVLDLQDNKRVGLERLPAMDGEVFMSRAASSAYCVTRFCLPLTFTFNLDWCRKYIDKVRHARSTFAQSTKYRLVGLVGNAREYGTIAEALHQARIPFIREARGKGNVHHTCVFYSQITLAVAWSPYIPTKASLRGEYRSLMVNRSGHFNQSSVDYWYKQKPPERFTNLQWFDIPTIGYDQYASYQAYGADFLCGSNSCVVDLIARIERGELDATVERVRQRVKADTSVEGNGAVLRAFLSDVYEFRQNQLSLQR